MKKTKSNIKDLRDDKKAHQPCITVIPEEREKQTENIFDGIMADNFLNLKKEIYIQVQKHRCPKQTYTNTYYNKNIKS